LCKEREKCGMKDGYRKNDGGMEKKEQVKEKNKSAVCVSNV